MALQGVQKVITGKSQVESAPMKKRTPTIKNVNNTSDDEMFDSLLKEIELNSLRTVNIVGWKLESQKMGKIKNNFFFFYYFFFFLLFLFIIYFYF